MGKALRVSLGLGVVGLAGGCIAALGMVATTQAASGWLLGSLDWFQLLGRMLGVVLVAGVAAVAFVVLEDVAAAHEV